MAKKIDKLLEAVSKRVPGIRIMKAKDVVTPYSIRRPTGILTLDVALKGGFAAGTLNQVFGPDGIGKDLLTNVIIATNQRIHGEDSNAFWCTLGYKPDLPFMRMCGVKLALSEQELRARVAAGEDLKVLESTYATVGNVIFPEISDSAAEAPAELLLSAALELIRSDAFQIGIINELASGETKDNVVKNLSETAKIATWASLLTNFLQKYYTAMRELDEEGVPNKTTTFVINPVRANMDANSAKYVPYTQPGGHALKHAKAVDVHLTPGPTVRDKSGRVVSRTVYWKIGKGKLGIAEGSNGEYRLIPNVGVDMVHDTVQTAKKFGIVYNKGKYHYVHGIPEYSDRFEGGLEGFTEVVREEPALREALYNAAYAAAMAEISGKKAELVIDEDTGEVLSPEGE